MTAVAAPADRRFRRAHVKPAKRRRGWRALVRPALVALVVAGVGSYGAYRAVELTAEGRVLRITQITVHGNARLSRGEVLALVGGLRGQSLLWTDLDSWRQRLLASAWVRDAALRRTLPSTIDVVVSERKPIGIARLRGDMYLMDERGQIIDQYGPPYEDLDLPIVDGLLVQPEGGDAPVVDDARARLAARLLADLAAAPIVARRVSQIKVADGHDAAVILNGDPAVIHLGDTAFVSRLRSYLELSGALHDRVPAIDYVDMRFDDRVYVRPAGRAAVARTSR
jgi:cell division septal protein FtsQ